MRFYGRKKELEILQVTKQQSENTARMLVITGRRRIGKTMLALEFIKDHPKLYLFVSKKSEVLLCQEYARQIQETFKFPIVGTLTRFSEIFQLLLEIGKEQAFTLVIDEFQEFASTNPSVFSDIQRLWDLYKQESRVTVLFMGSVYSLMNRIFQNQKEPLFGRADRVIELKPFTVKTLWKVLEDHGKAELPTLFHYFMLTGGIPKYVDALVTNGKFELSEMIEFFASENSPFLSEGRNVLIEEFGKEYATYFSILELIAAGKSSRSEIESVLEKTAGGHLERLEQDYGIVRRIRPINAKPGSRSIKYQICDNFLRFWFRFIYRHRTAIEMGNFSYVQDAISRNIQTYSGALLELFFHNLYAVSKRYNLIGQYWERGNQNEIDLVAVNDTEKRLVIAEIKQNKKKIDLKKLKEKASRLLKDYRSYEVEFLALSLEDAEALILE